VIKILKINILKYIKLITINPQCCNINSIKSVKIKPFHILQLFSTVWIKRTDICVNHMNKSRPGGAYAVSYSDTLYTNHILTHNTADLTQFLHIEMHLLALD
jgi:hypothetical protein